LQHTTDPNGHNEETDCIECAIGTYADTQGSDGCLNCRGGTTTTLKGATTCGSCPKGYDCSGEAMRPCEPGTYSSGNGECISCPIGHKCKGSSDKDECPRGYFAGSTGLAECVECPAGKFQGSTGGSACRTCGAGFFCPPSSTRQQKCGSALMYCPIGSSEPTSASEGFYTVNDADLLGDRETRSAQVRCDIGFKCNGGERIGCYEGKTFQSSEGEEQKKRGPRSSKNTLTCVELNFFAPPLFTGSSVCLACASCEPGKFQSR
jgi:hypothetical protein